ncbi:MAG: HPP family protein [Bacillota bacterium]
MKKKIVKTSNRVAVNTVKIFPYIFRHKVPAAEVFWSAIGSFIGIGVVAFLALQYRLPTLVASLGATAVLVYAAINSPLAQPRNVIGGHLISALVGVLCYQVFGTTWWSIALGVSLAVSGMVLTGTVHPPGGATAIVAVWSGQGYAYIFSPVVTGAVALVLVALLVNNIAPGRIYPTRQVVKAERENYLSN